MLLSGSTLGVSGGARPAAGVLESLQRLGPGRGEAWPWRAGAPVAADGHAGCEQSPAWEEAGTSAEERAGGA